MFTRRFYLSIGMIALVMVIALLAIWLLVYPAYRPTAMEMTAQAIRENNEVVKWFRNYPAPTPEFIANLPASGPTDSLCIEIDQAPFWVSYDDFPEYQSLIAGVRIRIDDIDQPDSNMLYIFPTMLNVTDVKAAAGNFIGWYPGPPVSICIDIRFRLQLRPFPGRCSLIPGKR